MRPYSFARLGRSATVGDGRNVVLDHFRALSLIWGRVTITRRRHHLCVGDAARVAGLLLPRVGVAVEGVVFGDTEVRLAVRSSAGSAACPGCRWRSSRVHCYYQRSLADRPVAGRQMRLDLRARRLVCGNDSCGCRTFAEQIPDLTHRHARRTNALTAQLTYTALLLGGRAGVSLRGLLALTTGKDTLLRLLRALAVPAAEPVPCLGVDELADAGVVATRRFSST
ncbi:transposase family protein [Streptomyces sp. bgisy027]|uniref:transposase family protein n=1 Tax=Streptomyces sp. bgisy027 TaxID=3413770 RepID=UPI003D71A1AA